MQFLRIIFGCPEGARKWRILYFAMLLHSKQPPIAYAMGGCCLQNYRYVRSVSMSCIFSLSGKNAASAA